MRLMGEGSYLSPDPRLGGSHVSNSSHVENRFAHTGRRNSRARWLFFATADATIVNVRPNNRLKLTARGRPTPESLRRTRVAA